MLFSCQRGADWLYRMNGIKGRFLYGYLPALKIEAEGDHYLRQVGAAFALARAARFLGEERYAARSTQAILTLLDDTVLDSSDPPCRHTSLPSVVVNRLGAAGLLVLAINELPAPQPDLLDKSEQLCNWIRCQARADGSLHCGDAGDDDKAQADDADCVNAYPGLALYAVLRSQKHRPAAWKTELARKAVPYLPGVVEGTSRHGLRRRADGGLGRSVRSDEGAGLRGFRLRDERLAVRLAVRSDRSAPAGVVWRFHELVGRQGGGLAADDRLGGVRRGPGRGMPGGPRPAICSAISATRKSWSAVFSSSRGSSTPMPTPSTSPSGIVRVWWAPFTLRRGTATCASTTPSTPCRPWRRTWRMPALTSQSRPDRSIVRQRMLPRTRRCGRLTTFLRSGAGPS